MNILNNELINFDLLIWSLVYKKKRKENIEYYRSEGIVLFSNVYVHHAHFLHYKDILLSEDPLK